MGTWRIDPPIDFETKDDGKTIEINFGENKDDNQTYVVTYTDDLGNCGKTTIVHQGGCGGPEPPQPVGDCNLSQTRSNIENTGFTGTVITYNTESCDASSIRATSTTEGVNLSVGDGIITMEVGPTDSQRTIDVTVKVTIDGEEKTYDFTFIQSGSSPTPPTGYGTINIKLTNNTGSEIRLYGESIMNISTTPSVWNNVVGINVHLVPTHSHGWEDETNTIVIPAGGTKEWSYNVESKYLVGTYGIVEIDSNYGVPLYLYAMYYSTSSNKVKKGNGFYHTKVNGHQYLTDGATINVEADYLGVAGNVGKIILADSTTRISTIPSDKTYVILLPNQTTLPA